MSELASRPSGIDAPLILVGGGLANGLIAYRLKMRRPERALLLLERGATLGGNHTWSFHETDVPPETLDWLAPFVVRRWPGQTVRFHGRERRFETPYCSITSERLHELVTGALGDDARTGADVRRIAADHVELADGTILPASGVIDGRGRAPRQRLELGWQKFLGLEIETTEPHGVDLPVIMDATVPQTDGYRFIYVLPFRSQRLLIEDTHYSDAAGFDAAAYEAEVLAYAAERGWRVSSILRRERGALPITLDGDIDGLCADMAQVARVGLSAGFFHPTTGYSLPDAAKLADHLAAVPSLDAASLPRIVQEHARALWRRRRLYRLLNRMLFHAARPEERHRVLSHFYRLPQPLVERFYGDRLTLFDKSRVLTGRPPVPIGRAVKAMLRPLTAGARTAESRP
jgi:lycopene beta-cyclase